MLIARGFSLYPQFADGNGSICQLLLPMTLLSYFTVFSLVPLLSVLIMLIGFVVGKVRVLSYVIEALGGVVGSEAGELIRSTLVDHGSGNFNLISSLIAGGTLLIGVIIITSHLQSSLDKIFNYIREKRGFWKSIRIKIASFSIVLILAVLTLIFMILSTGISFLEPWISSRIPYSEFSLYMVNFLLSFIFILGFSLINFRFLPHVKLPWKSVATGALVTSILFTLAKLLISFYLEFNDPSSVFGAAGTILVILIWVYFSAQILFFGACVAYVHSIKERQIV